MLINEAMKKINKSFSKPFKYSIYGNESHSEQRDSYVEDIIRVLNIQLKYNELRNRKDVLGRLQLAIHIFDFQHYLFKDIQKAKFKIGEAIDMNKEELKKCLEFLYYEKHLTVNASNYFNKLIMKKLDKK